MEEYKTQKGWAILIYIAAPILITSFMYLFFLPFIDNKVAVETAYFFCPLGLICTILMLIVVLDTMFGKLIIDENNGISIKSTLINRSLNFNEIKGFKIEEKYIYILPKNKQKKRIKTHTHIERYEDFIYWLYNNFTNLNDEITVDETKDIVTNLDFGINKSEREHRLKQAKKTALILNSLGVLILLWALLYPKPYEFIILASIALPLISIFAIIYFKGLIRLDQENNSAYPTLFWAIIITALALLLRALFDFNIIDYTNVWLPTISLGILLTIVVFMVTKELKSGKVNSYFNALFSCIFFSSYAYGALIITNCYYDSSDLKKNTTTIIHKRINFNKIKTYHFTIAQWKEDTESEEITVSKKFYEKMEKGDTVFVNIRKGKFNIPWFEVTDKNHNNYSRYNNH